jgi:hypothetical protein
MSNKSGPRAERIEDIGFWLAPARG